MYIFLVHGNYSAIIAMLKQSEQLEKVTLLDPQKNTHWNNLLLKTLLNIGLKK